MSHPNETILPSISRILGKTTKTTHRFRRVAIAYYPRLMFDADYTRTHRETELGRKMSVVVSSWTRRFLYAGIVYARSIVYRRKTKRHIISYRETAKERRDLVLLFHPTTLATPFHSVPAKL